MFSKYYQSELTYLRELGREFAQANPTLCNLFSEGGGDPDVERLLEGFAFLAARIRERADDAVPEVVGSLSEVLLPHYLRSVPASTIVEFTPKPGVLRGPHRVAQGTPLAAKPLRGTRCLFRTTEELDLLPLQVARFELDERQQNAPQIRLQFRTHDSGLTAWPERDSLRLFLSGPLGLSSTLLLWFARHLGSVALVDSNGKEFALPQQAVRVCAEAADKQGMWPWPSRAPLGPRKLQEYFTLPAKLLFFDVEGLARVTPEQLGRDFSLVFRFDRPPALPEAPNDQTVRTNCVPATNLFQVSAEPIAIDPAQHDYLLRAAGIDPAHAEVFSVDAVVGLRSQRQGRINYLPFFDYGHADDPEGAFFSIRRTGSPIDGAIDQYLSIRTPRDRAPSLAEETLSIDLTCTNRKLPAELRAGDVCKSVPGSPTVATFRNISTVSQPAQPPMGDELHWRLMSHLAAHHRTLTDPEVLTAALGLYNFQGRGDQQVARANERRTSAIRGVESGPALRIFGASLVRGMQTTVALDETGFAGVGDAYLFGCALDAFFGHRAPINSFHRLGLRLEPSGHEIAWQACSGSEALV